MKDCKYPNCTECEEPDCEMEQNDIAALLKRRRWAVNPELYRQKQRDYRARIKSNLPHCDECESCILVQKEIKLTDLFKAWIKQCEKDIDTDDLSIDYDDGVSYQSVDCEMRFELEDKPSWSSVQRAVITFENEHDEKLNVEIPVSKWIWDSGKEEPYKLSVYKDLMISSLRGLNEFEVLLLRLSRAGTAIIIDEEYDGGYIHPEKEPEASFS